MGGHLRGWSLMFGHTWIDSVLCPGQVVVDEDTVTMEACESSGDELGRLDIDLDRKSLQHNLTSSNVRAILHVSALLSPLPSMDTCMLSDTSMLCSRR